MDTYVQNEYDFSEVKENDTQPLITNGLGRKVLSSELIYQDGYFGDVCEADGIANGETGRINIDAERIIRTAQIVVTDTLVKGEIMWFVSGGSSAAGKLRDEANGSAGLAVGVISGFGGTAGAHTYVEYRPFVQRLDAADVSAQVITNTAAIGTLTDLTTAQTDLVVAINEVDADMATNATAIGTLGDLTTSEQSNLVGAINEVDAEVGTLKTEMLAEQAEPKILVREVTVDHSSAVAVPGLVDGDKVIGMKSICNVSETVGTIQLLDGASAAISDALQQATANEIAYAATFDVAKTVLSSGGAKLIATGTDATKVRCTVVIEYIPVAV